MMDRALRRADVVRSGLLLEELLSLALDSTTLGMMKPGVDKGGRALKRFVAARELLLLLRASTATTVLRAKCVIRGSQVKPQQGDSREWMVSDT